MRIVMTIRYNQDISGSNLLTENEKYQHNMIRKRLVSSRFGKVEMTNCFCAELLEMLGLRLDVGEWCALAILTIKIGKNEAQLKISTFSKFESTRINHNTGRDSLNSFIRAHDSLPPSMTL